MEQLVPRSLLANSLVVFYFGFLALVFLSTKEEHSSRGFVASFAILPSSAYISYTHLHSVGGQSNFIFPRREGIIESPRKSSFTNHICLLAKKKNSNTNTKKKNTKKKLEKLLKEAELSEGEGLNNSNLLQNKKIDPSILKDTNLDNGNIL